MINVDTFEQLVAYSPSDARGFILTHLDGNPISFNSISNFPNTTGIYFLYENDNLKNPLYIGSAFATSRSLKVRCNQYLQKGNGGDSFRGKIEILKSFDSITAIEHIKNSFSAKFVEMPNTEENKIKQLEQIAIWAFSPKLNFILKNFTYEHTKF